MVVTNDQPLPPFVDNFIQSGARKRAHRGGYKALLWKAQNVYWWGWLGKPVENKLPTTTNTILDFPGYSMNGFARACPVVGAASLGPPAVGESVYWLVTLGGTKNFVTVGILPCDSVCCMYDEAVMIVCLLSMPRWCGTTTSSSAVAVVSAMNLPRSRCHDLRFF